jgi:uncharacterized protein YutE (UPF0331/DUF86 family)
MDRLIVERKLDSLERCLARIRDKTSDSVEALKNDLDLQDVLVLNLSRAVQICVDIASHVLSETKQPPPETMGGAFDQLMQARLLETEVAEHLKRAVGFRNLSTLRGHQLVDRLQHRHPAARRLRTLRSRHRPAGAGRRSNLRTVQGAAVAGV